MKYSLDLDNLTINAISEEENNKPDVDMNSENVSNKLTHCPNLLQYIIRNKDTNDKYIAMLDPGSSFSAINAEKAQNMNKIKAPYKLQAGLAASADGTNKNINKIKIEDYVEINYNIGHFNDTYPFRVFPNLQADLILGLDWLINNNPQIPCWESGIMFLKQTSKNKCNTYKIKPHKPLKFNSSKIKTKHSENNIQTGLISADEVNQSADWDCLILLLKSSAEGEPEYDVDFYKPHFQEPPLYTPSEPLTLQQQKILADLKTRNHDVLKTTLPKGLPPHREGDNPIAPTIPGAIPVKKPYYQLSPSQNLEIKKQLTSYIEKGYLKPSHSPWGAPVFLVKKPHSDQWRMVCDWRGLNKLTIKDRFEIPNPVQLFDKLEGAKWFTKLDLAQGYHQIPLTREDQIKSAIVTRYGSYEWTVASFGMCNVPSVFQRVLGKVLFDYIDEFVVNFFDDILIYTKDTDFNTHLQHIQLVLNKLKQAQLYANPEKCCWFATSLQ